MTGPHDQGPVPEPPDALQPQPTDDAVGVPVSPAQVEQLLSRLTMRQMRIVHWNGDAPPGPEGRVENVDARLEPARMRISPGGLSLWFEHHVECSNANRDTIATIDTGIIVDFDVAGDEEPELPVVACFADTNAAFMAWPYIREAVQTMSTRLGLSPITLGILLRDAEVFPPGEA